MDIIECVDILIPVAENPGKIVRRESEREKKKGGVFSI